MQSAKKKLSKSQLEHKLTSSKGHSPSIHHKLLERYTLLIEEKHKAVDFGIELTEERDLLRAEIKRLSGFLERERSSARGNVDAILNLEKELKKTRSLHEDLQKKHGEMSNYLLELESQVESWKLEFAKVLARLKEEEKQNKNTQKSQKSLVKRIREMEKITQKDQQEHGRLVTYIATLEDTAEKQDEALQNWSAWAEQLKSERNNLVVEVSDFKKLVQDLKLVNQNWEEEHGKLVQEIKRMESELEQWNIEHSKLTNYTQEVEKKHAHEILVIKDLEEALASSNQEKNILHVEHSKLCLLLEETQGIRDHLQIEHAKLVSYIAVLEEERNQLKIERQEFLDAKEKVEGELRFIQSRRLYRLLKWFKQKLG